MLTDMINHAKSQSIQKQTPSASSNSAPASSVSSTETKATSTIVSDIPAAVPKTDIIAPGNFYFRRPHSFFPSGSPTINPTLKRQAVIHVVKKQEAPKITPGIQLPGPLRPLSPLVNPSIWRAALSRPKSNKINNKESAPKQISNEGSDINVKNEKNIDFLHLDFEDKMFLTGILKTLPSGLKTNDKLDSNSNSKEEAEISNPDKEILPNGLTETQWLLIQ